MPVVRDAGPSSRRVLATSAIDGNPIAATGCADADQWKERYPVVLPEYRDQTDDVSTYAFSEALSEELDGDD